MNYSTFKNRRKPWGSVYGKGEGKRLVTRTPLKSHTSLKAKKNIKKVGKVGKANQKANKRLKEILTATTCEIGALGWPEFTDCKGPLFLQNVHKHKRAHYKGNADLLSDYNEVVRGCTCCHERIEHDKELTARVFTALRPTYSEAFPVKDSQLTSDESLVF